MTFSPSPAPPPPRSPAVGLGRLRAHPDALALTLILGVALFFRGQFVFRAPMFMQHDSLGYFLPAFDLATGQGFGVGFRRTPVYPLFLSGVLITMGVNLTGILIVKHLLGAVTAGLTYWLGRVTFGRLVGLVSGLLVAINGALIVGEHYLMSEGLFIPLLALSVLALIGAGRADRAWRFLLAGLLLALTALCRPIAQALFPLVPLGLLLLGLRLRQVVRGTVLVAFGVLALLVPWTLRNCLTAGECSTTGVMGQAMLARTAYYDHGFVFYDENDPERGPNAPRPAIRASIQRASRQNFSGGVIVRRLQDDFKWSDAETARIAREMALDVIRRQPVYYLTGSVQMFWQIFNGEPERLRDDWKTQGRRASRDEWGDRLGYLLSSPTPQQEAEFGRAEAVINVWQPAFWAPWLPLLSLVGLGSALLSRGPARAAALLGLASLMLMLVAAAFDGPVPRYRYPADPYIAILAAGGGLTLGRLAWPAVRRFRRPLTRDVGALRGAPSIPGAAGRGAAGRAPTARGL
jgi:4-amino-4-deoxy-L-arabinose transferase-like glycosyltransferase